MAILPSAIGRTDINNLSGVQAGGVNGDCIVNELDMLRIASNRLHVDTSDADRGAGTISTTAVPGPSKFVLAGLGLVALAAHRFRRGSNSDDRLLLV